MDQCQCGCGRTGNEEAARGPASREDALKLLEEFHPFPCEFQFKVIGYADSRLQNDVKSAVEEVLGPLEEPGMVGGRTSSQGRYESITVEAMVQSSAQVLEVYASLRKVSGLVSIF